MQNVLQNVLLKGDSAMARPRLMVPSYRKHSKTGRAVVTIKRTDGTRTHACQAIPFSQAANDAIADFERWIEPRLAPDGDLAELAGWATKLAGPAVRIATILHCLQEVENDPVGELSGPFHK